MTPTPPGEPLGFEVFRNERPVIERGKPKVAQSKHFHIRFVGGPLALCGRAALPVLGGYKSPNRETICRNCAREYRISGRHRTAAIDALLVTDPPSVIVRPTRRRPRTYKPDMPIRAATTVPDAPKVRGWINSEHQPANNQRTITWETICMIRALVMLNPFVADVDLRTLTGIASPKLSHIRRNDRWYSAPTRNESIRRGWWDTERRKAAITLAAKAWAHAHPSELRAAHNAVNEIRRNRRIARGLDARERYTNRSGKAPRHSFDPGKYA